MLEDKLSQFQRIRLEALALSIQTEPNPHALTSVIIERAKEFDKFIREGSNDAAK